MKRVTFIIISLLLTVGFLFAQENVTANLTAHMNFLCSDEMNGRKAGAAEGLIAAQYIFDQFEEMGLNPQMEPFSNGKYRNVVGEIPSKNGKYILVGAHYDHIGNKWGKVCNGADDNASGTSVLIETARIFSADRQNLEYGLLFVAFDGEEIGLLGSKYNVSQLAENGRDVVLMINMDMVGHLEDEGRLICEGAATLKDGEQFVRDNQLEDIGIRVYPRAVSNGVMTDTYYYDLAGIPVLNFYTGLETSEYHRPTDDVETIDIPGMALITEQIVTLIRNAPAQIVPSGASVYEDKTISFGITYEFVADTKLYATDGTHTDSDTRAVSIFGEFPLFRMLGANIFFVPELSFRTYLSTLAGEKGNAYQFTVPLALAFNSKTCGIEQSVQVGPYYSVAFDTADNVHQEAGIKFAWTFRPYNNIDMMNHLGVGMQGYLGVAAINSGDPSLLKKTKNLAFAVMYYF